jgi:hypothetical protein
MCYALDFPVREFKWGSPPYEPGVQHVLAHYYCSRSSVGRPLSWLQRQLGRVGLWKAGDTKTYEATFCVPFDITIVRPEQADKVVALGGPELDAAMRAAITWQTPLGSWRRNEVGSIKIKYSHLPQNCAFRMSYEDEAGQVVAKRSEFVLLPKDGAGDCYFHLWFNKMAQPGLYHGKVRIETDAAEASQVPGLAEVWDGSFEIPVSFEVLGGAQ